MFIYTSISSCLEGKRFGANRVSKIPSRQGAKAANELALLLSTFYKYTFNHLGILCWIKMDAETLVGSSFWSGSKKSFF